MNNFRLLIRKNTPKLRDLLNNLGYHYNSSTNRIHSDGYIYITDFKYYIVFDTPANCIDCGEDEQMFIKYLYKHTECYIREHNKTELTINQKRLLENSIYGSLSVNNNNFPVEEIDAEIVQSAEIDNDILTEKTLCTVLCNISEDRKEQYKDRVVFIKDIPVEKQKEFIECFKSNDENVINTTLEIIMNDYSKDKIEIINPPTTVVENNIFDNNTMELFNYAYHLTETKYLDGMRNYSKIRTHTTKHQPDKKSKKSARRNNRRAKRNNR